MNAELKEAFARIKPVCDVVMVCPSSESVASFSQKVCELRKEALQELQQYVLFPFITHLRSTEIDKKFDLQSKLVDAMRVVIDKVTINSYEMCLNIETGLMNLVFDYNRNGMIAEVPEELKHSVMRCLTVLMLNISNEHRTMLLKTQVPLLAQAVFVSVHIAKLEKLRPLRLAGLKSLMAHTCIHPSMTNVNYQINDREIEKLAVDMVAAILPGVLAALQDVATCTDNPGHLVVVTALQATHRILCLVMSNKYAPAKPSLTTKDFVEMIEKKSEAPTEVSNKAKVWDKNFPKLSDKWYVMAGEKLTVVTRSLIPLRDHDHYKVRKELAVYCTRVLTECDLDINYQRDTYFKELRQFRDFKCQNKYNAILDKSSVLSLHELLHLEYDNMQPSIPMVLDGLLSLSYDPCPDVAQYSAQAVKKYLSNAAEKDRNRMLNSLCDTFFATLRSLPRVLNSIDSGPKQSALHLIQGYLENLREDPQRPQRLTAALTQNNMHSFCTTMIEAAAIHTDLTLLTQIASRDVSQTPPLSSPWCRLRNLPSSLEPRLRAVCGAAGALECADLLLDRFLELHREQQAAETVYLMNWMAAGQSSSPNLAHRVLETYIDEDAWYLPLEVGTNEPPITSDETLDVSVYNPRGWIMECVPDLYEGAIEMRYTDITYSSPRTKPPSDPNSCSTLSQAQKNMTVSCLMTEGVGLMARKLKTDFLPYLMKTLCLLLERVGSKYEMLHLSGLKAINDVALACNHTSVAELIRSNADYFTNQITVKLKKAWNVQSALHILSVVMEYSDSSILDYLQGIVENVLVQSCDKHHDKDLHAYLQVFLTFLECIQKWFPSHTCNEPRTHDDLIEQSNIFQEVIDFIINETETNILLNETEVESGRNVDEMYREDQKMKEENELDYDDTVAPPKPPPAQHISVVITILNRCLNFVSNRNRDDTILALQVLNLGLPLLREYEDELLPLVHMVWSPLVSRFECNDPVVLRRALQLLVTMAGVAKDFITSRSVKEVLPNIYKYLQKSAQNSYLKDVGSAYRNSQAYTLQVAALTALPQLVVDLMLDEARLDDAMDCVDDYLSNKQPKPLQALAVKFFQTILDYDHGAAWHHLRKICSNDEVLHPPELDDVIKLSEVKGTPYTAANKDYDANVKLVFEIKDVRE